MMLGSTGRWSASIFDFKDSRKNKFTILVVEALNWQGAKVQAYKVYAELLQRRQMRWFGG